MRDHNSGAVAIVFPLGMLGAAPFVVAKSFQFLDNLFVKPTTQTLCRCNSMHWALPENRRDQVRNPFPHEILRLNMVLNNKIERVFVHGALELIN